MAAPTVYRDVEGGAETNGQLFTGKKFFVVQRVPSRVRLLEDIKANGGEVVLLEKLADYIIADHLRPKYCPPGSISYEFVEKSIKAGEIRDPGDHPAGPSRHEAREPGAINRLAKTGRIPYTAEEDRILYNWVRDAEAAGGLISGNEIYKRLEVEYPSHTWQSWRDHYLKRLRDRPPSAFNLPALAAQDKGSGSKKVNATPDYTLDQLAGWFSSEDWEELYAFVDHIDATSEQDRLDSWASWAESRGNQSADQWQQYYDKVVRPQWLRDPPQKRQEIKDKIQKKYDEENASQSDRASEEPLSTTPQQPVSTVSNPSVTEKRANAVPNQPSPTAQKQAETEVAKFEQLLATKQNQPTEAAYTYYAREKKSEIWAAQPTLDHTALHKILIQQWHSLSDKEQAPYIALNKAERARRQGEVTKLAKPVSESKLMSSSTARHESPIDLKEMYASAMKRARIHDISGNHDDELGHIVRPAKRRRNDGPTATEGHESADIATIGTHNKIIEISSQGSETSQSQNTDEKIEDQLMSDKAQFEDRNTTTLDDEDKDDLDVATESIESDEHTYIDDSALLTDDTNEASVEETPLNSPTPRGPRLKKNYDIAAIVSSPLQEEALNPKPQARIANARPKLDSQRSRSPSQHFESDASTTQSLQEFRRSLNEDDRARIPTIQRISRPSPPFRHRSVSVSVVPSSPPTSSPASPSSGDPDPPLTAAELDIFFQEQHNEGFGDDYIVAALKRTRMRPALAIQVLDAWAQGEPLPDARGIWSVREDADVERGDEVALDRLGKKHSINGWGGVTERRVFLEGYRSR